MNGAVDRIMPPPYKAVHVPILRTCIYFTSVAKGTLQVHLRTLTWGDYLGLFRYNKGNHKGPYKGKTETGRSVKDGTTEAAVKEVLRCYSAGFESTGRDYEPRHIDSF